MRKILAFSLAFISLPFFVAGAVLYITAEKVAPSFPSQ